MKILNPKIHYTEIDIMAPRYNDQHQGKARPVLIAPWNIGEHNIVSFSKARHLEGVRLYMSGTQIRTYPTTEVKGKKNGQIYNMYTVPMTDFTKVEPEPDDFDALVKEYDELEARLRKEGIIK